jgi:hypothetical protein
MITMKKPRRTISIILIAVLISSCSACTAATEMVDNNNETKIDVECNDIDIDSISVNTEEDENNSVEEIDAIGNSSNVLDGINVNDLFSKRLGEVIDILGSNHTGPIFYESPAIIYMDSCRINYAENYGPDDEPILNLEAEITSIEVIQEVDIYKGIRVGKTLDEINSNPDLLNKFVLVTDEDVRGAYGEYTATGFYEYNGTGVEVFLGFNENIVCIGIYLKPSKENPGYVEV